MKKIVLLFLASFFFASSASAASVSCSSYMFGKDGNDIYLRLDTHVYGPFDSVEDLRETFKRLGPDFQQAISAYIMADPDPKAIKKLVQVDDITQCLPYKITRKEYAALSLQITKLFRVIHFRYMQDAAGELIYFKNRKTKLDAFIATAKDGVEKTKAQIFADRLTRHLWYLDEQKRTAEAKAAKTIKKK